MNSIQASHILDDLDKCVTTFHDQLLEERELLVSGDANDLNRITTQKQITINQLSILEANIPSLIDSITNDETLNKKWQNTLQLLLSCQQANTDNSSLVNLRLKQTNNTLHQLHSLFDKNHSSIYSEDGSQKISSEPNRSVHA